MIASHIPCHRAPHLSPVAHRSSIDPIVNSVRHLLCLTLSLNPFVIVRLTLCQISEHFILLLLRLPTKQDAIFRAPYFIRPLQGMFLIKDVQFYCLIFVQLFESSQCCDRFIYFHFWNFWLNLGEELTNFLWKYLFCYKAEVLNVVIQFWDGALDRSFSKPDNQPFDGLAEAYILWWCLDW